MERNTKMANMRVINEVKFRHIKKACKWAMKANFEMQPLAGKPRLYNQETWRCGTSCCIWGAAWELAGNGQLRDSVHGRETIEKFAESSEAHDVLAYMLCQWDTEPQNVLGLLEGEEYKNG
jgi:hypothetical protein